MSSELRAFSWVQSINEAIGDDRDKLAAEAASDFGRLVAQGEPDHRDCLIELGLDPAFIAKHFLVGYQSENGTVPKPSDPHPRTDLGNATRLALMHGSVLRFTPAHGWLHWNGIRWKQDSQNHVRYLAQQSVLTIKDEGEGKENEANVKWCTRSQSTNRISAMLTEAEVHPSLSRTPSMFDADPWLFNCKNGTMDLRTGEFKPHRQEDHITLRSPVEYDPEAKCPRFLRFLDQVLPDKSVQQFLIRYFGYCLTGRTEEHCFTYFYGTGRNGKTVTLETLEYVLGDYAHKGNIESFQKKRTGGGPSEDIASMKSARLVWASEPERGAYLAEALVKEVTGGETMRARHLYRSSFEFKPQFKLVLIGNYLLNIRGTDPGIWSRIYLVPFKVEIAKEKRDKRLVEKLVQEAPGILNVLLQGCRDWQREGLGESKTIADATAEYRAEQDDLGQFMDECLEVSDSFTPVQRIREVYLTWCKNNQERPMKNKDFVREMQRSQGCERKRHSSGFVWWYIRPKAGSAIPNDADYGERGW